MGNPLDRLIAMFRADALLWQPKKQHGEAFKWEILELGETIMDTGYQVEKISDVPLIYAVTDSSGYIFSQHDNLESAQRAARLYAIEDDEETARFIQW